MFFVLNCLSYSQWSNDPNENTRVTRAALSPIMVSDDAGGAFIVYENDPGLLRQKYVQRLDRYGYVKFPGDGIIVSAADKHQTPGAVVVADGANGIIIGYEDFYSQEDPSLQYSFPYVQRIDSSGTKLWGEMGVQVSADTFSTIRAMCPDGAGGVFLLYRMRIYTEDPRLTFRLQLQHVSSSGEFLFGQKGIKLNEKDIGDQSVINYDGQGGIFSAITVYNDNTEEYNLSLHYITKDGQEIWNNQSTNLVDLKILFSNDVIFLIGFIVEYDIPSRSYFFHLRSRVIDWDGDLLSPESGFVIKDSLNRHHYEAFIEDSGDAILLYDKEPGSEKTDIHAQRLTSTGTIRWGENGIPVFPYDYCRGLHNAVYDRQHGVIAIWKDSRFNPELDPWGKFVYAAQRISFDGKLMWPDSGVVITTQQTGLSRGGAVSDQAGGAIICWSEIGSDTRWGIFAQQVSRNGNLGEVLKPTGVSRLSAKGFKNYSLYPVYPNPFNENVKVEFDIPQSTMVHLIIFDISGKEVITLVKQNLFPGNHQLNWNGRNTDGQKVGSGIYIIFMKAGGVVKTQKAILIK